MSGPWQVLLSPFPLENQNTAPTQDGNPVNEDAAQQCGPTCVSMIIEYKQGRYIAPDTVKDYILGNYSTGISTNIQLIDALAHWGISASTICPVLEHDFVNDQFYPVRYGKPVIVLRHYIAPAGVVTSTPHWLTCFGLAGTDYTTQTITYADPAYGQACTETVDQAFRHAWPIDTSNHLLFVAVN